MTEQAKQFKEYNKRLLHWVKEGKVKPFPMQVFDALRPYHRGGLPLSIALFIPELCTGHCYDNANRLTLAFDDCKQLYGDIDAIRIMHPDQSADHSFVEAYGHIFDTTFGLMYTKEAYWDIERPAIRLERTKKECLEFIPLQEEIAGNFENDKYMLPLILPNIEIMVNHPTNWSTKYNQKMLLEEIEKLKKAVNYDQMVKEMEEDIANDTNRHNYRDIEPREPVDPSNLVRIKDLDFASLMMDSEMIEDMKKRLEKEIRTEEAEIRKAAKAKLKKVSDNPTANVYE